MEVLRAVGWSDEDIMDIAETTGMFNMSNRMASGSAGPRIRNMPLSAAERLA